MSPSGGSGDQGSSRAALMLGCGRFAEGPIGKEHVEMLSVAHDNLLLPGGEMVMALSDREANLRPVEKLVADWCWCKGRRSVVASSIWQWVLVSFIDVQAQERRSTLKGGWSSDFSSLISGCLCSIHVEMSAK